MKAVIVDRKLGGALMLPPGLQMVADSAITASTRPVFLPDFDMEWTGRFYLAIRVSRLGKNVAAKFANRYYDAVALAMQMIPVTLVDELRASERSAGLTGLFDNALVTGEWIGVDKLGKESLTVKVGESDITVDTLETLAAEAIALVSGYATIKMGDIITIAQMPAGMALRSGTALSCDINGMGCLQLRVR